MRALVVEDDPTIAAFVSRGLREAGFAVDTAHDGDEGFARRVMTPVLLLSARRSVDDRVRGLQAGGDATSSSPLPSRSCWRAYKHSSAGPLAPPSQRASRSTTSRSTCSRDAFLRHPGRVLSKTMVLSHVWGYQFDPGTNVLDVLVSRLLEKVDRPFERRLIHTVRGVGYVLRVG